MPSFKAPTGETTASKIKTLVLHLERTRGRVEADDFLTEVGVTRDLVHDETRPVSVAIWRIQCGSTFTSVPFTSG